MKTYFAEINIPGSKSIAARALICRLLSGHDTHIDNLPDCGDTEGMLRLTEAVRLSASEGSPARVDIGEGGTTLRFGVAACASIAGLDITLVGSRRLMERPHGVLIDALTAMGAEISPLDEEDSSIHIKGQTLSGGLITLDGSVSSQYLSAMMLAAPTWERDTIFRLQKPVVSRPYVGMTAGVMRDFGAQVDFKDTPQHLEVKVKATGYAQCAHYDVEGDWSGASYFFEAKLIQNAISCELYDHTSAVSLSLTGLKAPAESLQGDSRVAAIFSEATRRMMARDKSVMEMNLNDTPDLVPAIAVGLCLAGVPFRIDGVAHLRHKESDRMAAISTELHRLGFVVACGDDSMEWTGAQCTPEENPLIRTYQDHRMAMAFAPAILKYPSLQIEDKTVVAKSFPGYWEEISKIWKEH